MSNPLDPCRTCFWSAELTRADARIWCSHAVHHGWHTEQACKGAGYRADNRPASSQRVRG
jgi:hypothetical protein